MRRSLFCFLTGFAIGDTKSRLVICDEFEQISNYLVDTAAVAYLNRVSRRCASRLPAVVRLGLVRTWYFD